MNYWHLQMHPSNSGKFKKETLVSILEQKGVIGMGDAWNNKNGELVPDPNYFKRDMHVNDVVLIRDGGSPTALVQVTGNWFIENNINEDFDWFKLRRPVKLLKVFGDSDKGLLRKTLAQFGTSQIQSSGTLTNCSGSNGTNHFIKKWHLKVRKELIMSTIKLSDQRRSDIKILWKEFKDSYTSNQLDEIDSSTKKLTDDWSYYRNKIVNNSLTLDEYTNRLGNSNAQSPGGYLCNFLERETRVIYGSSKPGNANNFEIKLNEDGETYTIRDQKLVNGKNNNTEEQAKSKFDDVINPILYSIVNPSDPIDKIKSLEESQYAAKQILRKLAVLDNHEDFIYIYSDGVIDSLHNELLDSETETNLGKNHEIRIAINNVLGLDINPVNAVLISRFLWKYATSKGVADENTPNVILYGPPGTGKTYSVKQSLKFLCLGDSSRYEFVTFHPSFSYEDFIDGIKPKGVTKDGNIKFELVDGIFKKFCKKAKNELIEAQKDGREPKPYYFVVDEINRANLSSVFGETLMCLEKDYRYDVSKPTENLYKTQYSALMESMIQDGDNENIDISSIAFEYKDENAYFGVPKNVFFIGMMNDVDKSIDAFDLALRRRFKWIRMDYDADVLVQETKFRNGSDFVNIQEYANASSALNNFISDTLGLGKSYEFGHSFYMKIDGISTNSRTISKKNMEVLFNLYLKPSLKEYLRSVFPEQELDNKLEEALKLFKINLK